MVRGARPTTRYLPPRAIALTGVVVGIAARVSVCSLAEGGERGFVLWVVQCVRVRVFVSGAGGGDAAPLSLVAVAVCGDGGWREVETDGLTD